MSGDAVPTTWSPGTAHRRPVCEALEITRRAGAAPVPVPGAAAFAELVAHDMLGSANLRRLREETRWRRPAQPGWVGDTARGRVESADQASVWGAPDRVPRFARSDGVASHAAGPAHARGRDAN